MQIKLNNWLFEGPFGSTDRHVIDSRNQIVVDVGAGSDEIAKFIAAALNARIPQPGAGLPLAECRTCKAAIVWAVHRETGKKHPIDALPSYEGDLVINAADATWKKATLIDAPGFRWRSHFASCGQAALWRRR